jgi:hypothetical protein
MKKVILDNSFWSKIGNLKDPLVLCDEAGKPLGKITPLSDWDRVRLTEPELSEAEWAKIEKEPDISTAELLAQLEKL